MKLALNIKNMSKAIKPKSNDAIIYNGEDWYITTVDDLFKDYTVFLDKCKKQLDDLQKENDDFKMEVAKQLFEMSELIKKLYSK